MNRGYPLPLAPLQYPGLESNVQVNIKGCMRGQGCEWEIRSCGRGQLGREEALESSSLFSWVETSGFSIKIHHHHFKTHYYSLDTSY